MWMVYSCGMENQTIRDAVEIRKTRDILADCVALYSYRNLFFDAKDKRPITRLYLRLSFDWMKIINHRSYIDFDYYRRLRFDGINHQEASQFVEESHKV